MPNLSLNGNEVEFAEGETILDIARRLRVDIPTLCHEQGQTPEGGCRLCLVECAGHPRPVAACHTQALPGMEIASDSDSIRELRRGILSFYLETGNETGFVAADARGAFADLLREYDLQSNRRYREQALSIESSHPYLRFRADACITCRLCLNTCEQVQGQFVYGVANRGVQSQLIIGVNDRFADSDCVACGACVDVCPTGALFDRDRGPASVGPDEKHTPSVCGFCGVGCRVDIVSRDEQVERIDGIADAEVNHGQLCVKGRYAHQYHHSRERLTRPLLKSSAGFVEVSWDTALDFIAGQLRGLLKTWGPEQIGAFTSSRSTNEACYLLQKLFRAELGSNNVDCCARVCHSSTALALQLVTGTGAATASYQDLEKAAGIIVAGANPTEAHPVVGARIKQAVLDGAPLLVIDPRRIELAEFATIHLQLVPGTNVALFNGLAKVLIEEGLVDVDYMAQATEGFDELKPFLADLSLDEVQQVTGLAVDQIERAARLIGQMGPALFVHGLGLSELTQGTASVMTLCNLGMLTGSIGKAGAGMLPLRGQNNVQGSADMGSMPTHFTGYQPLGDAAARARIESIWGKLPPEQAGLPSTLMLKAAAEGDFRGVWLMGEDVLQSDANSKEVEKALQNLDLIIVQDLFFSETCNFADVILPSCGCLEQEGTFTNGERRIQHVRPAVQGPGDARPDWIPVVEVAKRLGATWDYHSPADVMDEIAAVAPRMFGGVSYDRLSGDGLQWPCPDRDHPGTATVHADGFLRGKGKLVAIDYAPSPEHGVDGFPYLLVTGRLLEHYNVGTMTRRTPNLDLVGADHLEVHPEDLRRERIHDNDKVCLASRWGEIEVTVAASDRVAPGTLFLSFHFPGTHTNRLTGPALDPQSKCPQYKATAVKITTASR